MTEVISVKFKNKGKSYYFDPNGLNVPEGSKVVVETAKGLELADCVRGKHPVDDNSVVQPLRPVVRLATVDDLRVAEINKGREKEAFEICQQQIEKHKLDMKLVDVECNFEGNKTTFFFTAEDRVDFRELVKDLAGIFRNRIELRQIGVRDEAKLMGGIGICGRPYCCHQFMDEFAPVSTKMAKVQSLSLNPTKICGSCGRLMCCLRYEQEAYEELVKNVPKQGAFVETKDGYGTAVQVNLLRQTVKVKLDDDSGDSLHIYKPNELAAVPGGRPRDGSEPPHVLNYVPVPEEPEEEPVNEWVDLIADPAPAEPEPPVREPEEEAESETPKPSRRRGRHGRRPGNRRKPDAPAGENKKEVPAEQEKKHELRHVRLRAEDTGRKTGREMDRKPETIRQPVFNGQPKPGKAPEAPQPKQGAAGDPANRETVKPRKKRRYYYGKRKNSGGKT
ncbi:MAG: stage 0 sporulation family protein [Oscillospiraceae bacterium]|nr:stage 0 sporulation family protein [Oscillospiraceae bacterium]